MHQVLEFLLMRSSAWRENNYVSNASSGLMGMWFYVIDEDTVLKAMRIRDPIEDFYHNEKDYDKRLGGISGMY